MKNNTNFAQTFVVVTMMAAVLAVVVLPVATSAATYAFVNTSGDVSTIVANDPYAAIDTAVNRTTHSGVILLMDAGDYGILE